MNLEEAKERFRWIVLATQDYFGKEDHAANEEAYELIVDALAPSLADTSVIEIPPYDN